MGRRSTPDLLEWVSLSDGGKVTARRSRDQHVRNRFRLPQGRRRQRHPAAARRTHRRAGRRGGPHRLVPDRSGHVRVAPACPASTSSATPPSPAPCRNPPSPPTPRPRSARDAVVQLLAGNAPAEPRLINTCYSLVAPGYGISVAGVYRPVNGQLTDIPGAGGTSPLDAPAATAHPGGRIRRCLVQDDHQLKRLAESLHCPLHGTRFGRRRTRRRDRCAADRATRQPGQWPPDRRKPPAQRLPAVPRRPVSGAAPAGQYRAIAEWRRRSPTRRPDPPAPDRLPDAEPEHRDAALFWRRKD